MSPEAKEAQKEKNKLAMQKRRELETNNQKALIKNKHREKQRLTKKRNGRQGLMSKLNCTGKMPDLE